MSSSQVSPLATPILPTNLSRLHIPAFDGLRGLAILAVISSHLSDYFPSPGILKILMRAGWCGVDLFFVLSGFLITGILLDSRTSPHFFRAFYARRVLRIFPLYYAALSVILLASHIMPVLNAVLPSAHDRVFYFFYLNNWWPLLQDSWRANIIGHFWSLAVEEQFYLLWPLLIRWLRPLQIEKIAVAGIILAPVIRLALYAHCGNIRDIVENPFCRMDSLLIGGLLASLVRRRAFTVLPYFRAAAIFVSAIIAGAFSQFTPLRLLHSSLFIGSGVALVFGALVAQAFQTRNARNLLQSLLTNPALRFCGTYSYGMYIFHVPLLWLLARLITHLKPAAGLTQFLLLSVCLLALTTFLAKLSFDYFESHFLKWKTKFVAVPAI